MPTFADWVMLPENRLAREAVGRAADALVSNAAATVMHAATIRAPVECVWPWLVQMGAGRAGWYSYDWVDNGGKPSASEVIPASIYCTGGCHAIASRCRFLQRAR